MNLLLEKNAKEIFAVSLVLFLFLALLSRFLLRLHAPKGNVDGLALAVVGEFVVDSVQLTPLHVCRN